MGGLHELFATAFVVVEQCRSIAVVVAAPNGKSSARTAAVARAVAAGRGTFSFSKIALDRNTRTASLVGNPT